MATQAMTRRDMFVGVLAVAFCGFGTWQQAPEGLWLGWWVGSLVLPTLIGLGWGWWRRDRAAFVRAFAIAAAILCSIGILT